MIVSYASCTLYIISCLKLYIFCAKLLCFKNSFAIDPGLVLCNFVTFHHTVVLHAFRECDKRACFKDWVWLVIRTEGQTDGGTARRRDSQMKGHPDRRTSIKRDSQTRR